MFIEQVLVELLKKKGTSIEEICTLTGFNPEVVMETLTKLQLLGIVEEDHPELGINT